MKTISKYRYAIALGIIIVLLAAIGFLPEGIQKEVTNTKDYPEANTISPVETSDIKVEIKEEAPHITKEIPPENHEESTAEIEAESKPAKVPKEDTPKPPPEKNSDQSKPASEEKSLSEDYAKPSEKASAEEVKKSKAKSDIEPAEDKKLCSILVQCHTLTCNTDKLKDGKKALVPSDGVIYYKKDAEFFEDETAFNVVLRELRQNRIPFEFVNTPMYNSIYIEGINGIYEFDAGPLSGWMYKVNGKFLNYSLSEHLIKPGDKIEILYTCDLGKDLGAPVN